MRKAANGPITFSYIPRHMKEIQLTLCGEPDGELEYALSGAYQSQENKQASEEPAKSHFAEPVEVTLPSAKRYLYQT